MIDSIVLNKIQKGDAFIVDKLAKWLDSKPDDIAIVVSTFGDGVQVAILSKDSDEYVHSNFINFKYLGTSLVRRANVSIAYQCGFMNRVIYLHPFNKNKIVIGCFVGTKKEALRAVKQKYIEGIHKTDYIKKINQVFYQDTLRYKIIRFIKRIWHD